MQGALIYLRCKSRRSFVKRFRLGFFRYPLAHMCPCLPFQVQVRVASQTLVIHTAPVGAASSPRTTTIQCVLPPRFVRALTRQVECIRFDSRSPHKSSGLS